MPIKNAATFAKECVLQGLYLGVNSHYLLGAAKLRSDIKDDTDGDRVGPYGITQQIWNANSTAADLEIILQPGDISLWRMQVLFAALNARRAQEKLLNRLGRFPSAVDLYREQFGDDSADLPDKLQEAMDATADLIPAAVNEVLGEPPADSGTLPDVSKPANPPAPEPEKPIPKKGDALLLSKSSSIMAKLTDDFDLTEEQAAAILGNIGHECAGFRLMQEVKPLGGGRGGFGWCQWTASRRTDFETFCRDEGLDPTSDAANYGNLKRELLKTHKRAVKDLKAAGTLADMVVAFELEFERAHKDHKHYPSRERWAKLALANFKRALPKSVTTLLDDDLMYKVLASAKQSQTTYWLIEQFSEGGGQILIKDTPGQPGQKLASDTSIFPLQDGLVPPAIAAKLEAATEAAEEPPPLPDPPPTPASDNEISIKVLAKAKECNGTLVSRDVAGTSNGKLACAWAANEVVRRAIGSPVGGGLSTIEMGKVLRAKHTEAPQGKVAGGMIVISPTQGRNVGHVGVVGTLTNPVSDTIIYSNSSRKAVFSDHFTLQKWQNHYRTKKGLPVLFYALRKQA